MSKSITYTLVKTNNFARWPCATVIKATACAYGKKVVAASTTALASPGFGRW